MTLEAWAPGNPDPSGKIIRVADIVKDHTLLMHDTTSLFGNDDKKLKKILSEFEQSFGKETFKKRMPGKIFRSFVFSSVLRDTRFEPF